VHGNGAGLSFPFGVKISLCVKGAGIFCGEPFVNIQPVEVVGVNDGELAPGEGYAAERVAVAEAAI